MDNVDQVWTTEIELALHDFVQVANLAGYSINFEDMNIEYLSAPHCQPRNLPDGKMAMYGFSCDQNWLKIGIAGPKSQARYTSQHYNSRSAPSTLAKSLSHDRNMEITHSFDISDPGNWIRTRCNRVNVLLDSDHGRHLLALLEAFMHARLKPKFER